MSFASPEIVFTIYLTCELRVVDFLTKQSLQDSHFNYCFGYWKNAVQDGFNFEIEYFNLTKALSTTMTFTWLDKVFNFKVLLWQLSAVSEIILSTLVELSLQTTEGYCRIINFFVLRVYSHFTVTSITQHICKIS